jgi:hypothetical protein
MNIKKRSLIKLHNQGVLGLFYFGLAIVCGSAPAYAADANGADGFVGTNVTVSSGSFAGMGGGFTQEYAADASANGGAGFSGFGNTTVSNGSFSGGDGGYALSFQGSTSADGGSGLLLHEGNSTLYGGTFVGGVAGLVATNPAYAGVLGQDGAGVEINTTSGSASSLSILGGDIQSGIKIDAGTNAMVSLHVSTNASISGKLIKQGGGTLGIRDWQAGTLQQMELQNGTIALTNRYVLQAGGLVRLAAAGTELQALDGMVVDGTLSGVAGSVVTVYSNMTISGTVSGTVQMSSASGNTLVLQAGGDVAGATFSGNGALDRLQLAQAGTYSAASLGMGSRFSGFERVELSAAADIWQLTSADLARTGFIVDAGGGSGDLLAMAQAGTYDLGDFDTTHNTGFELFGLSTYNDVWIAGAADSSLGYLDARGGVDEVDFSNGPVASSAIGATAFYRNFEGIRLSSGNDTWLATNAYSQLDFINANGGIDTLSYAGGPAVSTNALAMGSSAYYRGFEQVALTGAGDTWQLTEQDAGLSRVDALSGVDVLSITDARTWSSADAARYNGFETLALNGASLGINSAQPLGFGDIRLNGATLDISANATVVADHYYQDAASVFRFMANTNDVGTVAAGLQAGIATFETNSTFQFYTPVSSFARHTRYTNMVVEAGMLIIGSETNTTDLSALALDESLLVVKNWYVGEDESSIYTIFDRRSLAEAAGVESNTPLGSILLEIDTLPTPEADAMLTFIDQSGMTQAELANNLSQVYERSIASPRLASHQRNEMLGQVLNRTASFRLSNPEQPVPEGAAGPAAAEPVLAWWLKGYGSLGTGSDAPPYHAYDMTLFGSMVGIDRSAGDLLYGLAAGVFAADMAFDNQDDLSSTGFNGSLYASLGRGEFFIESSASFALASMQATSGSRFDVASDYGSSDMIGYLGLGTTLRDEWFVLVPELAVVVNQYSQDAFTDSSDNSVPAEVEAYSHLGIQTRLGLTSYLHRQWSGKDVRFSLKGKWMHELNETEDRVSFTLLGGSEQHDLAVLSPAVDLFEVGFGVDVQVNRALALEVAVDYLFGSGYAASHVDAGVVVGF